MAEAGTAVVEVASTEVEEVSMAAVEEASMAVAVVIFPGAGIFQAEV